MATKLQPVSVICFSLRLSHWAMCLQTAALGNNTHTHTHTHTHTPSLLMQKVRQNGSPTSPSCVTNYTLSAGCIESNTTYQNYSLNHEKKGSYFQKSCMKTSQVGYNFELKSVNTTADEWSVVWLHATYSIRCKAPQVKQCRRGRDPPEGNTCAFCVTLLSVSSVSGGRVGTVAALVCCLWV